MKNTDFYLCPKEDMLIAAKESQKSAQNLFDTAKEASTSGRFGLANSLMILSVEECIKSAILLAGYFNVKLSFDVEPYFRDHKTKHIQAAEIQPLINIVWKIREIVADILRNRQSVYGTIVKLAMTHLAATIGIHFGNEPRDFGRWWGDANKFKNNGLYVGFFEGKWNFPSSINEISYNETLAMTQPFVECLQIVHDLRPDDYLELSFDQEFSSEQIQNSEIKLLGAESGENVNLDFSDYKSVNKNNALGSNSSFDKSSNKT